MTTVIEKWEARGEARGILKGRQEGILEGVLEGRAKTLHAQIERHFGTVPTEVRDRIHEATEDELARYAINIFDAQSAREVVELSEEITNRHQ